MYCRSNIWGGIECSCPKKQVICQSSYSFDTILSEKDKTAFVEVKFMQFAMSQQSRYGIKQDLCSIDVDKHRWYFMQRTIFHQLNANFHSIIINSYNKMSLDRRYDALLSDLLTLFQELTLRYIQQKTIDIQKFRHYFNLFYDRMQHLEESFHQSKLKITHLVARLKQSFSNNMKTNSKYETIPSKTVFLRNQQPNQDLSKSFNRSISSKKQTEISYKLGSIVEEEEFPAYRSSNKRSQTAAGYRSLSFNDEKTPIRPKTGQISTKKHSFDKQKISKTINIKQESLGSKYQVDAMYQHPYVLDAQQILNKRKMFYEQLQKQKNKQSQPLGKQQMKWIFKRKKSKNGWGKKINRLI